ncbi:MAG: hypothetical protein AVDCRST_MAG26-4285 [uncultured Chloroflexia bacterium]|uniref:Glycosyltransferase RgtA/B/C/D-like domain-containing protein n=1 Tax=uncultured Chloroflexia bacterium TaxID=1672391 RepID=A0A6J4K299_9CHLR|nr:MAG: hypothetical protein AVDCRST_MAG26-4285 [uncultured Chloroflexia bacterium]
MHHMKYFLFPVAIFAAALVSFALLPTVARPAAYDVGAPGDEHIALGFLRPEANPEGSYRWTDGDSTLRFWGSETAELALASVAITWSVDAPEGTAALWLESGERLLAGVRPPSGRRVYSTLLPSPSGSRPPELRLRSTTFQQQGSDRRLLGVVVHDATVGALGLPRLERAAFLAVLAVLAFAGVRVFARARYALAVALALIALLAAAMLRDPAGIAWRLPTVWALITVLVGGLALVWAADRLGSAIHDAGLWAGAGVVLGLIGQVLLREHVLLVPGGLLLIGGVTLAAAALAASRPGSGESTERLPGASLDAPLLALCLLLALALRLFALDSVPFGLWRDEARHGLLALQILDDPTYRPVYVPGRADIPALLFYLQSVPIALLGPTVPAVRLVSALAGGLTVVPIYFLGRLLVGRRAGLAAAFLLAVSSWHIALSRLAFAAVLDPLFTLSALALLAHITTGRAAIGRRGMVAEGLLAGACAGLALNTYHSARLMPLAVVAVVLAGLRKDAQAWRRAAPGLLAFACAALVVALPLLGYIATQPGGFNRRVAQVGFTNSGEEPASLLQNLEYNVVRYLLMWNVAGDPNARHHVPDAPMLDPVTGLCFAIGVVAMARGRRPCERLLLVLLIVGLIPGLLSGDAPHAVRTVAAISPALLIAAWSALGLARILFARRTSRRAYPPVVAAAGTIVCALNVWVYFGHIPYDPRVWEKFEYVTATMIGSYVQEQPGPDAPFVPWSIAETDPFLFLSYGRPVRTYAPEDPAEAPGSGPILLPADADEVVRTWVHEHADTASAPRAMRPYPGTNDPTFWVYAPVAAVTPEEMQPRSAGRRPGDAAR